MAGKTLDIANQHFTRLLAIKPTDRRSGKSVIWECLCNCGKVHYVPIGMLRNGNTKSCGCLNSDRTRERMTKYTVYDAAMLQHYRNYRQGAKARDIVFDLSFDQFRNIVLQECFYCGTAENIMLINIQREGSAINVNGIDRLNSDLGYIIDNCVAACSFCNLAKRDMLADRFIDLCKRIAAKHNA